MSNYNWNLPNQAVANQAVDASRVQSQTDTLYGRDLWLAHSATGVVQRQITPHGDWLIVDGIEALRQAIIRRIITSPGEWKTLPGYGVGARDYVKARNIRATRDELTNRIRDQLMQDARIAKVEQVVVEASEHTLRINVQISPRALGNAARVGVTLEL